MLKMIVFDMDGTIADLYGVPNWLAKLRASDVSPYAEAAPMWDMDKLARVLEALRSKGVEIAVVTWLGMGASPAYKKQTADVKRYWLNSHHFPVDRFHAVQYGATKADSVRNRLAPGDEAMLIDDSAKVRQGWHLGPAVDPTDTDILELLAGLAQ